MKILFLDIDGVICMGNHPDLLDVPQLLTLQFLVKETDCKIVLSSDWRRKEAWLQMAREQMGFFGLEILDITPIRLSRDLRWLEIREWLNDHKDIENFAILDDDVDAMIPDRAETFFFTDYNLGGLNLKIAKQIVKYFNE